jgi:DNA-binding FrmR family transcriptional regulator
MGIERQKKEILLRLKRIEGQIRGIQRMIEEDSPCPDILNQVAASTSALKKVCSLIIHTYTEECLDKMKSEPISQQGETLKDFQKVISRYIDIA